MRFVIQKNGPREYETESRTGRIRCGFITTWDVVDTRACVMVSEHRTKRDATLALAQLLAKETR